MSPSRSRDWLDIAVRVAGVLVVLGIAYVGWMVWSYNTSLFDSSPAGRAIAQLREGVKKHPNDVGLRMELAQALAAAGKLEDSAGQYEAILRLKKENVGAMSGLALIAMREKQYKVAQGYWERIISLLEKGQYAARDDRLEQAYYYLGSCQLELKQYEDAAANLKQALRIRKDGSDTHFLLAHAYKELGSPGKYREELEIALAFDPKMPEANFEMGEIMIAAGDEAAAAEYFRRSADSAPEVDKPQDALSKLGTASEHLANARASKETSVALGEARIAAALDPSDADAVRLVAQLFEKAGHPDLALNAWKKLLSMQPGDKEATAAIGRLTSAKR